MSHKPPDILMWLICEAMFLEQRFSPVMSIRTSKVMKVSICVCSSIRQSPAAVSSGNEVENGFVFISFQAILK